MNAPVVKSFAMGLFFAAIFISGFWLSHAGKPLNAVILAAHKLISLGAAVYLGVTVFQLNQAGRLGSLDWLAVGGCGLLFILLVATGGFLSTGKEVPVVVLRLHQALPFFTLLSTAACLYLLLFRSPQ